MRAEAVSWDDWSVSNQPPIAEDDKWHVEVEPNDVKIVSLEQLDDLFRLSIVDSETKVWQAGMSDWQPLRVIAGLEEPATPPVPQARRAPPKPPSRAGSPSVRPAPPAARSVSPSVRPAAPVARTVAPTAIRPAPASFYPEPILAVPATYPPPVAYAAPLAFAQTAPAMNSVRPLVVTQAPRIAPRGGGGFGRFLIAVALLAGVGVTAYRNDYLREGAHAAHQDALYARLETALGGPAFGTLRALEQSAGAPPPAALGDNINSAARMAVTTPTSEAPAPPSTPTQTQAASPTPTSGTTPPVVSLESITPEKKGLAAAAAVAPTPAPVRTVVSPAQARPVAAPAPAPAKPSPVRAAIAPKPAVEKPVIEKPAPVPQKPASEMTERERLNAAIGQSMMQADAPKAKGKKAKSKGNEYDPLNGNL